MISESFRKGKDINYFHVVCCVLLFHLIFDLPANSMIVDQRKHWQVRFLCKQCYNKKQWVQIVRLHSKYGFYNSASTS